MKMPTIDPINTRKFMRFGLPWRASVGSNTIRLGVAMFGFFTINLLWSAKENEPRRRWFPCAALLRGH
jgi:hypothetical protein